MVKYEDSGYAADRPFQPAVWTDVAPDMPPGVQAVRHAMPPGFFMMQNYLDLAACRALVSECERLPGIVQGVARGEDDVSSVLSEIRISETVDIFKLKTDVVSLVRELFVKTVAPHYGVEFEWFERPEILRYKPGGLYKPHSDAENWFAEDRTWKRVVDRDVSILLYLNDGFTGGEIAFPNFGLQAPPQPGMLMAFPSDARYLHTARPVQSGVRYALVSWAAVKGTPRVQEKPGDIYRI